MMKQLKNKKGMTLIEVILAIFVVSISMTIIYTGFVTSSTIMQESKVYTQKVQLQKQNLIDKKVENIEANVQVIMDGNLYELVGTYNVAKSNPEDDIINFIKYEVNK